MNTRLNYLNDLARLIEAEGLKDILIQAHNGPDADAFGSAFAVFRYLKFKGYKARIVYSGDWETQKANMKLMKEMLGIPVVYEKTLRDVPELLITVDCCYGCRNVQKFEGGKRPAYIAVIDHHRLKKDEMEALPEDALRNIQHEYNSCAALIAKMFDDNVPDAELIGERFTLNTEENVATALYYGLYMDTCALSEMQSAADKDLCEAERFNQPIQRKLANSNISREELHSIGTALNGYHYQSGLRNAIVEVNTEETGVLGIAADMLIQVDDVDTCIAYFVGSKGYKVAVRSCVNDISAADLIKFIMRNAAPDDRGGGHFYKAGGLITNELIKDAQILNFLMDEVETFHKEVKLIRADSYQADLSQMKPYRKKKVNVGYVCADQFAHDGDWIHIHMLEGDTVRRASADLYFVVGVIGEVYPLTRKQFEEKYMLCNTKPKTDEYTEPSTVLVEGAESSTDLKEYMQGCQARISHIYAKKLEHYTRVFPLWDSDNYLYGNPGDYLVCAPDNPKDVYMIQSKIMEKLYCEEDE